MEPAISTALPDRERDELTALLGRITAASRRAARAAETIRASSEEIAEASSAAREVLARTPRSALGRSATPRHDC